MTLFGDGGDHQSQKGGQGNTQNIGIPPDLFVKELQRKDAEIAQLIADKEQLRDRVADLEKAELERELSDLRQQKEGLESKLTEPQKAYRAHIQRGERIAELLDDQATEMALGENRIKSALAGFNELDYDEIDALLAESRERGLMMVAKSAYGRGLVAEDAVRWADAAEHYGEAARYNPTYDTLRKASDYCERSGRYEAALGWSAQLVELAKEQETQERQAAALNEHAINNGALGRYPEAEGLYREALEIDRATIGEGHPDYATRLNNLATVLRDQDKPEEARPLFEQALAIYRDTLPADHHYISEVEKSLAALPPKP